MADARTAEQTALVFYETQLYPNSVPPMPSVDDMIVPSSSCAIVWQNNGGIQYGQTVRSSFTNHPFVDVSQPGASAFNPSVCYKTFRADSLDVVWTERAGDRYRVMYRCMAKIYAADGVRTVTEAPKAFRLMSVSPNPFNNTATIRYELASPARVDVGVYTLTGECVAEWGGEVKPEGEHTVVWNAAGCAGGLYLIRCRANGQVAVQKCMLIK